MTRWTDEAIKQRKLASEIVGEALRHISDDSPQITKVKNKILTNTLQVKWYTEFNIPELQAQLKKLKELAEGVGK